MRVAAGAVVDELVAALRAGDSVRHVLSPRVPIELAARPVRVAERVKSRRRCGLGRAYSRTRAAPPVIQDRLTDLRVELQQCRDDAVTRDGYRVGMDRRDRPHAGTELPCDGLGECSSETALAARQLARRCSSSVRTAASRLSSAA